MIDGIPFDAPDGYWNYGTWESEFRTDGPARNQSERNEQIAAIRALTQSLGTVNYAIRLYGGIIKIGYTADLATRRNAYPSSTILAFCPGDRDAEQATHARLVKFRAYGREYYHPEPEVIGVVNEMREYFELPPLAA